MPQNSATWNIEDYDGEKSSTGINPGPLDALNFDAKLSAIDDLKHALENIILGKVRRTTISDVFAEDTDEVTSEEAQRECKWLVTYRDNTPFFDLLNTISNPGFGNLYSTEVPTADLSLLVGHNDTLILTTSGHIATFVAAFEAAGESPSGGNVIIVTEIKHVGRNL